MSRGGMTAKGNFSSIQDDSEKVHHYGVEDLGWQALAPAIACTILSTTVVALRWYTRYKLARCQGWDDYVILLSVALSWAMTVMIGLEVHRGFGVYDKDLPASTVAKLVMVNNILWIAIVNVTKASILLQYLRVFSRPILRRLCIMLMVLLLPAAAWGIFGGIFLCTPVAKLWDPSTPGQCMSAQAYWYSVAGIDIALDCSILLFPMPAISGLRLPKKQKIGLLLVFLLGFFVCVVSVVRLLTVLVTGLLGHYTASGIWSIVWSAVEANVGIVCASLLALKPLAERMFPSLFEEAEPPRHSTHLPMIEAGVWPEPSNEVKLTVPSSRGLESKDGSDGHRLSSARISSQQNSVQKSLWSSVRLSQVKNFHVVETEDAPAWGRASERMSVFEILREDVQEARARTERRDSSFREHL